MLIRSLKVARVPRKAVNFVYVYLYCVRNTSVLTAVISCDRYVDEVQDNFVIDCLGAPYHVASFLTTIDCSEVLRAICSNPHGLFWAGDTAQTIAAGSSFRLKDLKALLYGADVSSTLSAVSFFSFALIIAVPYRKKHRALGPSAHG